VGQITTLEQSCYMLLWGTMKGKIFYKDMVKLHGPNTLLQFHQHVMLQEWSTKNFEGEQKKKCYNN
jgi:hypothetical protein